MQRNYQIHISGEIHPYPTEYEISAAIIISNYLKSDVVFVKRATSKTPDFEIKGKVWELKSPTGNSKRTMQNNLRKADNQSSNIILDLRRCKMRSMEALSRIKFELSRANNISHLLIIQKSGKIVELK